MFTAAALAVAAGGESDVHGCLAAGLRWSRRTRGTPVRSASASRPPARRGSSTRWWTGCTPRTPSTHHWVHVLPNAALLAAALTHADGDFTRSIGNAVSGGWDTDSNGATAGSLADSSRAPRTPCPTTGPRR